MKTDVDTLSYEIGMANTQGIEAYFRQMGIDSQYVDDFIRGLKDGSLAGDDKKQMAYYAASRIADKDADVSNDRASGFRQRHDAYA